MRFPTSIWCLVFVGVGLLPPGFGPPGFGPPGTVPPFLSSRDEPSRPSLPVLLVHGLVWQPEDDNQTWGSHSMNVDNARLDGMVAFLESQGLPFGGVIHFKGEGRPTATLDTETAAADATKASVFAVQFSADANTDGLAYKALELSQAIRLACKVTGAPKVRIVAYSAGGLVARVYLQSVLPGVAYRGDVDRLITIATPHLGSSLATHFGDLLGTRATSLKPQAALIHDLNATLDLPAETTFASIIVRRLGGTSWSEGHKLDSLVDKDFLARLPTEYRTGGDQVVDVRSQNLRLAPCAARYEETTGRPVQYVLAQIADPTPCDLPWRGETVHVAATKNPVVEHIVLGLLGDNVPLWRKAGLEETSAWRQWQARLQAYAMIETATKRRHPVSRVDQVDLKELSLASQKGDRRTYAFAGKAFSENRWLAFRRRWTTISGTLDLTFDSFGRVVTANRALR